MFSKELLELSERLVGDLKRHRWHLTTAESCTGGLIAACLTETPGASVVFDRGFITYHNDAKVQMLGVDIELIKAHGAVSEEVVRAMATGALEKAHADVALAVTGIAGPGGGTKEKPVGLIHIAAAFGGNDSRPAEALHLRHDFSGGRDAVRRAAVEATLTLGLVLCSGEDI